MNSCAPLWTSAKRRAGRRRTFRSAGKLGQFVEAMAGCGIASVNGVTPANTERYTTKMRAGCGQTRTAHPRQRELEAYDMTAKIP